MKFRLIFAILALAFSFSAFAAGTEKTAPLAKTPLRLAAEHRMDYLEKRHGIKFDREALKDIRFGIPEGHEQTNQAEYDQNVQVIYVNTNFLAIFVKARILFGDSSFRGNPKFYKKETAQFMSLLDHELGHALADQIARRAGKTMWPVLCCGERVISEGIAEFFECEKPEPEVKSGDDYFPAEGRVNFWDSNAGKRAIRVGGHWLVRPILEKYGGKGIEYLVTHKFDPPENGNMREAAKEYQKKALEELGKQEKK